MKATFFLVTTKGLNAVHALLLLLVAGNLVGRTVGYPPSEFLLEPNGSLSDFDTAAKKGTKTTYAEFRIDVEDELFRTRMKGFLEFFDSDVATDPESYETSLFALHDYMQCEQKTDDGLIENPEAYTRIPNEDDYALIIEAYLFAMAKNSRGDENLDDAEKRVTSRERERPKPTPTVTFYNPGVFKVPVEVRSIPHTGRGIFATEDISKGTLVSRPANAIEFYSKEIYRDFVAYAYSKGSGIICDTMLWVYAAKKSHDEYMICLDADDSSLLNSGLWDTEYEDEEEEDEDDDDDDDGDGDEAYTYSYATNIEEMDGEEFDTVDPVHELLEETQWKIENGINIGQHIAAHASEGTRTLYGCQDPPVYALRDIRAGEELLMWYGDFSESDGFEEMGYYHDL